LHRDGGDRIISGMNSRQRVLDTVARRPPDRLPRDYQAVESVERALMDRLGVRTPRELLDALGVDIVDIRGRTDPAWVGPGEAQWLRDDGSRQNFLGFVLSPQPTPFGEVWEHSEFLLREADRDALEAHSWPEADWWDFSGLDAALQQWEGLAVTASGPSVFQHPSLVRSLDRLLMDFVLDPPAAELVMDRFCDYYAEYLRRLLAAGRGRIDVVRIADDLATQRGLLVGREMLRRFVYPRLRRLIEITHEGGAAVMFHSCGAVAEIVEDLIELGVDVLDPVQPRAEGMEPRGLKERFGGRICLHGSIDTQQTLPSGTVEDVRREVRDRLELFAGGGLIVAPSHVLQPDVPVENILALYEAAGGLD
jgi:uroporphyrinogen decarboxylase